MGRRCPHFDPRSICRQLRGIGSGSGETAGSTLWARALAGVRLAARPRSPDREVTELPRAAGRDDRSLGTTGRP